MSLTAPVQTLEGFRALRGSRDDGGSGHGLLSRDSSLSDGLSLGGSSGGGLGGLLLNGLSLLGSLGLSLSGFVRSLLSGLTLALDGGTELGEWRGRLGFLSLVVGRGRLLLLAAKAEGERALALVALDLLLSLAVGNSGGSLGGLSRGLSSSYISRERLSSLNGGDDRGGLSDGLGSGSLLLGGSAGGSLGLSSLLLQQVAEDTGDNVSV